MRCARFVALLMLAAAMLLPTPAAGAQTSVVGTFRSAECPWEGIEIGPFAISPESEGYECGYVTVPERHADPDGPTIEIPVAVKRSPGGAGTPLFLAQGGPGGSAFEVFQSVVGESSIGTRRDIVIFNQRGTSFASPDLSCTETFDATGELLEANDAEADRLSNELITRCRDRLVAEGTDLSAFNSVENAADVPVIAEALGYERIDFYGVSYGSLLGLHLMRDHPETLRSVILDAVVPTQLNFVPEVGVLQERLWSEIFDHCSADPVCSTDHPNLEDRFFALVDRLDDEPLTVDVEDPETGARAEARLSGSALLELLFVLMYQSGNYAFAPRMIADVERGDLTAVEFYWPLIAFDRTFSEGMYYSVLCAEDADFTTADAELDTVRPAFAESTEEFLEFVLEVCDLLGVERLDDVVDEPVVSDIPTLLLSGRFDPITPPSNAELAAATLSNSTHVVHPYGAHGVAFGDPCIDGIVTDFLSDPDVPPDTSCVASIEPEETVPASAQTMAIVGGFSMLDSGFLLAVAISGLVLLLTYTTLPVAIGLAIREAVRPRRDAVAASSVPFQGGAAVYSPTQMPPPPTPTPTAEPTAHSTLIRWPVALGVAALYGLAGTVLALGLGVAMLDAILNRMSYLTALTLPSEVRWLFPIPWLLALLALSMVVIAVCRWTAKEWSVWGKLYYTPLAAAAVVGVVVAAGQGLFRF